jgi:hypothetical protein
MINDLSFFSGLRLREKDIVAAVVFFGTGGGRDARLCVHSNDVSSRCNIDNTLLAPQLYYAVIRSAIDTVFLVSHDMQLSRQLHKLWPAVVQEHYRLSDVLRQVNLRRSSEQRCVRNKVSQISIVHILRFKR